LAKIAFFLEQWDQLFARSLIDAHAHTIVVEEYTARRDEIIRTGRFEATLARVNQLAPVRPADALELARRLIALAPERREGWAVAIDVARRLKQFDEAIELRAKAPFDDLPVTLADLEREKREAEDATSRMKDRIELAASASKSLENAREAARAGRFVDVVAHCEDYLRAYPLDSEAKALLASAHEQLGELHQALLHFRELRRRYPGYAEWRKRTCAIEDRLHGATATGAPLPVQDVVFLDEADLVSEFASPSETERRAPVKAHASAPAFSMAAIAAEFVKEHWQKFILCLAVLLIVVSSTVGAHHLLGERLLWSRAGQCVLAVVYTSMIAAFGYGLVRWGAVRAGRIMLLTTLFVVPVNFSLAGELRLVILPSSANLTILLSVLVVLLGLVWIVCSALAIRGGGLFPLAFFILAAFDASAARGVPFEWGFSALVASAWIFLGAVWRLNVQLAKEETTQERLEFAYFSLGLLSYAFLFFAYRSGVFVLRLIPQQPTLMAIPVILAAIACVITAYYLPALEKDTRRVHLLRLGGYALAALAFALALAHPPVRTPLIRLNTLTTAFLGLALFASSLTIHRQPSYLYAALGAVFVAYFGVQDIVRDVMAQTLSPFREAFGYHDRLPLPFRALNGVVFNIALAFLAIRFRNRWHDDRLARHCHYIGVPLSIAACVLASVDPKAALLCLPLYVVLYVIGAWLFEQPRLVYLACAATVGTTFAISRLNPSIPLQNRALGTAIIGLLFWTVALGLRVRQGALPYRPPLLHMSVVLSAGAVGLALASVLLPFTVTPAAIAAVFAAAAIAVLVALDLPMVALAYYAVSSVSLGILLLAVHLGPTELLSLRATRLAIIIEITALAMSALAARVRRISHTRERFALYRFPLAHVGLVQVAVGVLTCTAAMTFDWPAPATSLFARLAIALGLSSAATWIVSRVFYPTLSFAYACVILGSAAFGVAALAGVQRFAIQPQYATLAVFAGVAAFVVQRLGVLLPDAELYRRPLLHLAFAAVATTWILCAAEPTQYVLVAVALTACSMTMLALTRLYLYRGIAFVALVGFLGAWICAFERVVAVRVPTEALWCACAAFALMLVLSADTLNRRVQRSRLNDGKPSDGRTRILLDALSQFALVLSLASSGFVALSATVAWPMCLSFALASLALLWLTRVWRRTTFVYLALGHLIAAILCVYELSLSGTELGRTLGGAALTLAILACCLWLVAALVSRFRDDGFYTTPLQHVTLLLCVVVFTLALTARGVSPTAFAGSFAALLVNVLVLILLTTSWRLPALTYASIVSLTAALYLVVFRVENIQPESTFLLGLIAVIEGIVLWSFGSLCLAAQREPWNQLYARPLFVSTVVLDLLALPIAYTSPWTMGLVGVTCLLLIKSFPSEQWLYAAFSAFACSVYYGWLAFLPDSAAMRTAVLAAFALWLVGLLVQRYQVELCRRLNFRALSFDAPCFHVSLAAMAVAIVVRSHMIAAHASPLTDDAWLPFAIAALCVLMLKPYPSRWWIHGATVFVLFGIGLALQPILDPAALWLTVFMIVALAWELSSRALSPIEGRLCRRLGFEDDDYAAALSQWSLAIFVFTATVTTAAVLTTLLTDRLGLVSPLGLEPGWGWTGVFLAIVLGSIYADQAAGTPHREWLRIGLLVVFPFAAWWLGVATSPVMRAWRIDPADYDPLITVAVALATVLAGVPSWNASGEPRSWLLGNIGEPRRIVFESYGWIAGVVLAVIAIAFTEGAIASTTAVTLLGATAVFASIAIAKRWMTFGSLAGLTWIATVIWAALSMAVLGGVLRDTPQFWVTGIPNALPAAIAALAAIAAAFSLIGFARVCDPGLIVGGTSDFGRKLSKAFEETALVAAVVALAHVGFALFKASPTNEVSVLTLITLVGLAIFAVLIAYRWTESWPVFFAQAFLVAAYFDYRMSFPLSAATDAIVLLLFAYIDFAVAETLKRFDLEVYARPTYLFALVMPILPLALAFREGVLDDVTLFTTFAAGAFYTVACVRLQKKSIGYAAAVLYNAFLWIVWSRIGWRIVDSPQFFLVPVGLSTILFAEANRRTLGRAYVNTLRNIGLVIIYLSLAYPVWHEQSFGAWLALLIFSLAGMFVGIGLQVQSFLWLGLACFCLDVLYQLGRMGMENSLAKWAIMLALGILLVVFVALNEKKHIVFVMRDYFKQVRHWE
jgi:tetratricopeptide (TPR) repeat protein